MYVGEKELLELLLLCRSLERIYSDWLGMR